MSTLSRMSRDIYLSLRETKYIRVNKRGLTRWTGLTGIEKETDETTNTGNCIFSRYVDIETVEFEKND